MLFTIICDDKADGNGYLISNELLKQVRCNINLKLINKQNRSNISNYNRRQKAYYFVVSLAVAGEHNPLTFSKEKREKLTKRKKIE